ncbi:MAG: triose-phosphate isomerase [Burkholderiaceae bacterium]
MQPRKKLVVGNWKMNGDLAANRALTAALLSGSDEASSACAMALCVPFPYLAQVSAALQGSPITVGSQDVSEYERGAYTGEVSVAMLRDFGCRHAIVGHSERRTWFGDTDERVALKAERAIAAGITPIVCVGETLQEREQGRAEAVVARQLDAVLERIGVQGFKAVVVAYEPIWAIGTGKTATPDEAQAMHGVIRAHVAAQDADVAAGLLILYGGSVKASNAGSLFGRDDIDGGLIGGASLVAEDFLGIVRAASASANSATA